MKLIVIIIILMISADTYVIEIDYPGQVARTSFYIQHLCFDCKSKYICEKYTKNLV